MGNGLFLTRAHLLGVGSHLVGGCDEKPSGDGLAAAFTYKSIYVRLIDLIFLVVALCLNSPGLPVPVLENEIDALIGSPAVRPFIPQPNLLDLGFPLRVMRRSDWRGAALVSAYSPIVCASPDNSADISQITIKSEPIVGQPRF